MPISDRATGKFGQVANRPDCWIELDQEWRLVSMNAHARERLGMGDECLGKNLWHLFPLSSATYAREILEEALELGVSTHFQYYGRELRSWFQVMVIPTESGLDVCFQDDAEGGATNLGSARAPIDSGARKDEELASIAESIYRDRRRRRSVLPIEMGEPQWDILLDLFVQSVRGTRVSIMSAYIAADVPPTTASRALDQLHAQGLVSRRADEHDSRRAWVALTELGTRSMRTYLQETSAAGRGPAASSRRTR